MTIDYSAYEEYFAETEEYSELNEINEITTNSIETVYKEELKSQIKQDIEDLGFNITNISLEVNLDTGEVTKINIYAGKEIEESSNSNKVSINKIEIGNAKEENQLSEEEIKLIKTTLEESYDIDYENITVNST